MISKNDEVRLLCVEIMVVLRIPRTFKDFRRRSVETMLAATGISETTHDEEYDAHVAKFHHMVNDMNECMTFLAN